MGNKSSPWHLLQPYQWRRQAHQKFRFDSFLRRTSPQKSGGRFHYYSRGIGDKMDVEWTQIYIRAISSTKRLSCTTACTYRYSTAIPQIRNGRVALQVRGAANYGDESTLQP